MKNKPDLPGCTPLKETIPIFHAEKIFIGNAETFEAPRNERFFPGLKCKRMMMNKSNAEILLDFSTPGTRHLLRLN